MAYIGKTPTSGNFVLLDSITTSATASYTMQKNSVNFEPQSANHMIVSLNGTIQAPVSSFTVSGSTLTFASALTSSDVIDFILVLGNVNDVGTATTVVDSAITKNKLNLICDSSSAGLTVKGDGSSENGTIQLNCSQNSHGVKISSPDHSSGQSYELILPTGNVTADKFLKVASVSGSGTTGIGQLSFADAGGTLVQTAHYAWNSGDTTATVQNCFNSTYRNYFIVFTRFQLGSNDEEFQFKPVNSSGNSESANTYTAQSRYYTGSGTGTSEWNGSNDGNITIMKNQGSGAGKFISGHMYYFDPMNTTDGIKGYTWMARHRRNGDYTGLVYGGGGNATTTAYTGINIGASSGTITNGLFTVYGIVDGS